MAHNNFAQFVVMTKDKEVREIVRGARLIKILRRRASRCCAGGWTRWNTVRRSGFPVQFRVIGPDPMKVREIGAEVARGDGANPNTVEPQYDWNEQAKTSKSKLDQDRIRAFWASAPPGCVEHAADAPLRRPTVTQYREGTELIDVIVRAPARRSARAPPRHSQDLSIPLPEGGAVPLSQLARSPCQLRGADPVAPQPRHGAHRAGQTRRPGIQAPVAVTAQIEPLLGGPIVEALPEGYRIETGGAVEESDKANGALFKVFPLMFLVMLGSADAPVAQLLQAGAGVSHSTPGAAIGAWVAALLISQRPLRLRRTAGGDRAGGHDHAQRRHPGGPDRP